MDFAFAIANLKKSPTMYLDTACVLSLGTFLVGYQDVDASAHDVRNSLLDVFPGASQADACTRAYLSYDSTETAMYAILDALETVLRAQGAKPEPGPEPERTFAEVLREPIRQRRAAMIIGNVSTVRLYNYVRGFLCGLEAVAPARAAQQAQRLAEFETWLQEHYEAPGAAWYKILRIYGGECEAGVKEFADAWDEFEKANP